MPTIQPVGTFFAIMFSANLSHIDFGEQSGFSLDGLSTSSDSR